MGGLLFSGGSTSGGGGGGAVTIADGADVTQGAEADVAWDGLAASATVVSILKRLTTITATDRTTAGGPFSVRLSDGAAFYDAVKTGQLPAALVGSRLDTNVGSWMGSSTPTVGQKAMSASLPVTLASDQTPIADSTTSGNLNANGVTVALDCQGFTSVGFALASGTLVATLIFEASHNNSDWDEVLVTRNGVYDIATYGTSGQTFSRLALTNPSPDAEVTYLVSAPFRYFRVRVVSYVSGTAVGNIHASSLSNNLQLKANDQTTIGTINAQGQFVLVNTGGAGTVSIDVIGGFVGTIRFQGFDGAQAPHTVQGINVSTGALESSITTQGTWLVPASGWGWMSAFSAFWTSGSVTVSLRAGTQSQVVSLGRSLPTGTNSIGTVVAVGDKTNNNAAPTATNVGVLPSLANANSPTLTEGALVLLSSDLSGNLRSQSMGLVSDTVNSYQDGQVKPMSLSSDGRLRVVTSSESYNFTPWGDGESWGSDGSYISGQHPLVAW